MDVLRLVETNSVLVPVVVMVGVVLSGCGSKPAHADKARQEQTVLAAGALTIKVPHGWYGSNVSDMSGPSAPTLRLATFPVAAQPLDQGQQAQRTMDRNDILITILDYGPLSPAEEPVEIVDLPVAIEASHIGPFEGFREPAATRAFVVNGHAVQLWVVFGSPEPSTELLDVASRALASLAVEPARIRR